MSGQVFPGEQFKLSLEGSTEQQMLGQWPRTSDRDGLGISDFEETPEGR